MWRSVRARSNWRSAERRLHDARNAMEQAIDEDLARMARARLEFAA
jgi:hypothetical protein